MYLAGTGIFFILFFKPCSRYAYEKRAASVLNSAIAGSAIVGSLRDALGRYAHDAMSM